jgi:tRNA(Arg) A34 adenosine deaminase TadA
MLRKAMQRAIALAVENVQSGKGGPFGAVVVRNGEIIAEGVNLVTSSNDPTAHAEVVALRRACQLTGHFELKDCELYSSCEPCPMCLGSVYWARVGRLYFAADRNDAAAIGFDDSFIYDEIAMPLEARKIPTSIFLREEALAAFQQWQTSAVKVLY